MKDAENRLDNSNGQNRTLFYVSIILLNILAFAAIGLLFSAQLNQNDDKLFNENLNNVATLNTASANTVLTYSESMDVKVRDSIYYIKSNNLNHEETVEYLCESNTDSSKEFQIIESGRYDNNGKLLFGKYSGISIKINKNNNSNSGKTETVNIAYDNGYESLYDYFRDAEDDNFGKVCFIPEFVDPDSKAKCFAVYRHVVLNDENGQPKLYTLLLTSSSEKALNASNMQYEYEGQSAVLINKTGDYIIKSDDYRNTNFYDYIVNYNRLNSEELQDVKHKITKSNENNNKAVNLFYVNYRGDKCVFSVTGIDNNWYSITSVPLASFTESSNTIDYSLIILIIFITLFIVDGITIYFVGKAMRYNVTVAEKATEEAMEANKAKSRFLSTMSHELRTPLNAIIGFSSIAKDHINSPVSLKDYLKKIEISSKLLLHLISDILDISAIESNKMKLNKTEFEMPLLIDSLSDIYYEQCKSKDIEFIVNQNNIHSDLLIGDSVRVNQILLNFLSNAVKFTSNNGKIIFSADEIERTDSTVVIKFTVTDTGCGISEEMRKRLFQPFERVSGDEAYKYSGTGLGLSIAKNLTELMEGKISAESTEGIGSTFCVELPFEIAEVVETTNAADNTSAASKQYNLEGKRVLLVEDNAMNIEITRLLLERVGIIVVTAVNGKLGYEAFSESDEGFFDAILMDVQMPIMNGYESTLAIRLCDHPKAKTVPIICMTADAFSEDVEKAISSGMNAHLSKPIDADDLYSLLNKYLA